MRSLAARIDSKDPSRMRAIEDRRAIEAEADLKKALDVITKRVISGNVTDPNQIQSIVKEELGKYQSLAMQRNAAWTSEIVRRASIRSDQLLKASGVEVQTFLGPRPITPQLRDALTLNVDNQIESLSASTKAKVTSALIEGVDKGDGAADMARRIVDATGMEKARAELIARDQTLKAYRATSNEQYRRYGIQQVKWLTAHDDRTCDECLALDGQVFGINEVPHVHNGTDIQCRCVQLPVIDEVAA